MEHLSIKDKREKAVEIVNSLKGISLSDMREIMSLFIPVAIKEVENKLILN